MAFTKKKKRRIIVDEKTFYYVVTGKDGWISLIIMSKFERSPKLIAYFDYHQDPTKFINAKGLNIVRWDNQFVVTPYTVHQVIKLALNQGWKPFESGKNMFFGHLDRKINLRLEKNKEDKIKQDNSPKL